jgi:hypothetical protein
MWVLYCTVHTYGTEIPATADAHIRSDKHKVLHPVRTISVHQDLATPCVIGEITVPVRPKHRGRASYGHAVGYARDLAAKEDGNLCTPVDRARKWVHPCSCIRPFVPWNLAHAATPQPAALLSRVPVLR